MKFNSIVIVHTKFIKLIDHEFVLLQFDLLK